MIVGPARCVPRRGERLDLNRAALRLDVLACVDILQPQCTEEIEAERRVKILRTAALLLWL
jgi:hypothetical protein